MADMTDLDAIRARDAAVTHPHVERGLFGSYPTAYITELIADRHTLLAEVDRLTALISCPACGQPGPHGIVGPFPNSTAGSDHRFQVAVLTNPYTGERLTDDRIERLRRDYAAIDGETT
jgi:hypothetical protein